MTTAISYMMAFAHHRPIAIGIDTIQVDIMLQIMYHFLSEIPQERFVGTSRRVVVAVSWNFIQVIPMKHQFPKSWKTCDSGYDSALKREFFVSIETQMLNGPTNKWISKKMQVNEWTWRFLERPWLMCSAAHTLQASFSMKSMVYTTKTWKKLVAR